MAVVSVSFDGTRVNDAEALGTLWQDSGGKACTLETDVVWQNTYSVSEKVGTSELGVKYYDSGTSYNYSSPTRVAILKVWVTNYSKLNAKGSTGGILEIGSGDRANYYRYYVLGNDNYPAQGGWQLFAIDPNVSQWRDATVGSPVLTAVRCYTWVCTFSGTSKIENVMMDAIDFIPHGGGLTLVGGDGASTDGVFTDFITYDQGTQNNRYGVVTAREGVLYVLGVLTIGSATATEFTDSNATVVFPSARVTTGFCGVDFGLQSASTTITVTNSIFNGRGSLTGSDDTRPDYSVTGTAGTLTLTGNTFNVFRNVDLTSKVTLTNCVFLSGLLITQSSATITGCQFSLQTTAAGVGHVLSNNPGLISNCDFDLSDGYGHAIRCATAGTYTFTGNTFTGYGATGSTSAAFYNNCTPTTVSSYSESNQDATTSLQDVTATSACGQSFPGNNGILSSIRFYLKKTGSPTGTAVAKIYAHSGTFGSTGVPTGAALATSETLTVSTLTVSYALTEFKFEDPNNITLSTGTNYFVVIEYTAGSAGNTVDVGRDGSSPGHGGNFATYASSTWSAVSTSDACFYVYSGGAIILNLGTSSPPTVRNDLGCSTSLNTSVPIEINGVTEGTRCAMIGSGGAEDGNILLEGYANSNGELAGSFAGTTPQNVIVLARNSGIVAAAQLDIGAFTDYTDDARDKTGTNDVTLVRASPVAGDAFYIAGKNQFGGIDIDVTVAGTTYVLTWEYWNGAWTALTVTDPSNSFKSVGWWSITFTPPSNWATTTVNGLGPFYYVRARITTGGGTTAQAEEISLFRTTKYYPFRGTGEIVAGSGLTSTAVWIVDPTAR